MTQAPAAESNGTTGLLDDQASRLRALVQDQTPSEETAESTRSLARPEWPPAPRSRRPWMIAVASGKGGVGKTNITVSLAHAMAQAGRSTTIIDGDLGLGNVDLLCGVTAAAHFGDVLDGNRPLRDVFIDLAPRLRLVPGASGMARLANLSDAQRRRLVASLSQIEGRSETIIVDCGAGIGPWILSLVEAADQVLIVTTPEPPAIADAYALIKCAVQRAHRLGVGRPQLELVVNQVTGAKQARAVHDRVHAVCERFLRLSLPLRGWVPVDPHVADAVRHRCAFVSRYPRAEASRRVRALSASILADLEGDDRPHTDPGGPIARILRIMRRVNVPIVR